MNEHVKSVGPSLVDLSGVSRLAGVRRPVASMWRKRFRDGRDPFPTPVSEIHGRPYFDAVSVAAWLERTRHGLNPAAVVEAALPASPARFDESDEHHVAIVDALLTLRALSGVPVGGIHYATLADRSQLADPDDEFLRTEVAQARPEWAEWADALSDAAFSPSGGSRDLEKRHSATRAAAGSFGPLSTQGNDLIVEITEALLGSISAQLHVGDGIRPKIVTDLLERIGEDADIAIPDSGSGRRIRRRMLCSGVFALSESANPERPRLHVDRFPITSGTDTAEILEQVTERELSLRDVDRALILAPARVLTDELSPHQSATRANIIRSGRVRAIVRLRPGLVATAPRESLALWVLGAPSNDISMDERVTAVADLSDVASTPAARADLTSDVVAALGSLRDSRAHAFRFARMARTTSLLATRSSLIAGPERAVSQSNFHDGELPALIEQARDTLGDDAPAVVPRVGEGRVVGAARIKQLITDRHLRVIPGTRVSIDEYADSGLRAITVDDLDDRSPRSMRRLDQLDFAARHPSAKLTRPGDIVFRTSPTPRAWVDVEGLSVAVYPARVLRIDTADPGGLVPELVVADIANSIPGAGTWSRWRLRRVAPESMGALREALADVATRRHELARRASALDTYSELLIAGVVAGAITFPNPNPDPAADAVSDS